MATFYSIDFDFFSYNGFYEKEIQTSYGTMNGFSLFDWGHNEHMPQKVQNAVWLARSELFKQIGLDLKNLTGVSETELTSWCDELECITDLHSVKRLSFGDSHAWAFDELRDFWLDTNEPVNVVSFDAHHDLGYGDETESFHIADCGNWLGAAILSGFVTTATVVYPDWRGISEWSCKAADRVGHVGCMAWTEWRHTRPHTAPQAIFVCRSSAWVPPWCDEKFNFLIDTLSLATGETAICLDCANGSLTEYNACEVRKTSLELR